MAAAFARLGWTPRAFWEATPRELAAALRGLGLGSASAPRAADLAALMTAYPDDR